MVQKNTRWNISKEKGEKIAHDNIVDILSDPETNKLLLTDLIVLLNQRTKHIKLTNHNKKKTLSLYINNVYGSVHKFLNNCSFYEITNDQSNDPSNTYISLIDKNLGKTDITSSIINEYKEWTLVDL